MSFTMATPGAPRPRARKQRTPLAPVDMTRTGARTKDGTWGMDRLDDDGTTWEVVHLSSTTVVAEFLSSLTQCRRYIGSGDAGDDLKRIQEHDGDGHMAADKACPRCQAETETTLRSA